MDALCPSPSAPDCPWACPAPVVDPGGSGCCTKFVFIGIRPGKTWAANIAKSWTHKNDGRSEKLMRIKSFFKKYSSDPADNMRLPICVLRVPPARALQGQVRKPDGFTGFEKKITVSVERNTSRDSPKGVCFDACVAGIGSERALLRLVTHIRAWFPGCRQGQLSRSVLSPECRESTGKSAVGIRPRRKEAPSGAIEECTVSIICRSPKKQRPRVDPHKDHP